MVIKVTISWLFKKIVNDFSLITFVFTNEAKIFAIDPLLEEEEIMDGKIRYKLLSTHIR